MRSGQVVGVPGENWSAIHTCLRKGCRGLAGGSTLARLLAEAGLKRNSRGLPPLQVEQILAWVEAEQQATGKWPIRQSGPVRAAPGETWAGIDGDLRRGARGLPGGATLAGVLRLYRNILLRSHWLLPFSDGQRTIATPAQWVALLVSRGALQEPDVLETLLERQRKFQRACVGE